MATSAADLTKLTERSVGGLKVVPVADRPPFINMMIYGNPGVGKTILAGSASVVDEMSPVLVIDIEGGTFSLRNIYPNVDVLRVQTWQQMQAVYDELRKGNSGYCTVILDSLTEIQKFSMMQIMYDLVRKEPDRDPDIPSMREWGKNIEQIRRAVRAFRDLPMNCIFTALAQTDKDAKSGVILTKPSLSGKMANEVAGFVDIVTFMYTKVQDGEIKRLLLSAATDTHVAKDRSGLLPSVLENPDMKTLHSLIFPAN